MNPGLVIHMPAARDQAPEVVYRGTGLVVRLFEGLRAEEVPPLAARLFAVCKVAQTRAARLAIAAALGDRPTFDASMGHAARQEALLEHGLQVFVHWPTSLGERPDHAAARLAQLRRSGERTGGEDWLAEAIFAMSPEAWLGLDPSEIIDWAAAGASQPARFIDTMLADDMTPDAPVLPPDCLAGRHSGHPALAAARPGSLAACHLARLVDCALMLTEPDLFPEASAEAGGPGEARVRVACTRGDLVHEIALTGERVRHWRMIAPTDRAFAHDGHGRHWLARLAELPLAARPGAARRIIAALDPCVESRIVEDSAAPLPPAPLPEIA